MIAVVVMSGPIERIGMTRVAYPLIPVRLRPLL
jgi:hypothetical protein